MEGKAARFAELEHKMADGTLWADSERARRTVAEVKSLKGWLEPYHALRKRVDEGRELNELLEAESHVDLAMQRSLETEADEIAGRLESLDTPAMLGLNAKLAGRRALERRVAVCSVEERE